MSILPLAPKAAESTKKYRLCQLVISGTGVQVGRTGDIPLGQEEANDCNSQGWERLKPGAWNSMCVSLMGSRNPSTCDILCCIPGC